MGLGAASFGRKFRLYSWVTILILVVFGAWVSLSIPQVAAGQPTPWLGALQRVNIYATMLWVAALAVALLRVRDTAATEALHASKLRPAA